MKHTLTKVTALLFGYVGIRAFKPLPVPIDQRSSFGEALTCTQTASDVYEPEDKNDGLPAPT